MPKELFMTEGLEETFAARRAASHASRAGRDPAAKAPVAKPAAAAQPRAAEKPKAAPARFTQADINRAVQAAVSNERNRIANVFASPASRGRERGCANLLSSNKGWSSASINRELPHLPTDRERAANRNSPRSDATWSKAYGTPASADLQSKGDAQRPRQESSDPWERAYASIGRER